MNRASTRQRDPRTERFRRLLLAKQSELKSSLEEMKFDTIARMGRIAEEDQAILSHDEFISLRRNSLDYEKLRQVEAALDRIASGDYGVCLECDEQISERRLMVLPWAAYCVGCQDRVTAELGGETRAEALTVDAVPL